MIGPGDADAFRNIVLVSYVVSFLVVVVVVRATENGHDIKNRRPSSVAILIFAVLKICGLKNREELLF
jgi:hypothetical protein